MSDKDTQRTATQYGLEIDRQRLIARRNAASIIDILKDFIPEACLGDASFKLTEIMYAYGIEITSEEERRVRALSNRT